MSEHVRREGTHTRTSECRVLDPRRSRRCRASRCRARRCCARRLDDRRGAADRVVVMFSIVAAVLGRMTRQGEQSCTDLKR